MSDDMQPGPELDRMIAEKVMGWQSYAGVGTFLRPCGVIIYTNKSHHNPWSPSARIDHAWEVVEQVRIFRKCEMQLKTHLDGGTYVLFIGDEIYAHNNGSTPAHAICLAALKTIGESHDH